MEKQFIYFLKQNNVYEQFMYNFNRRHERNNLYRNISFNKCGIHPYHIIYEAFDWRKTIEGYDFWYNMNNKWRTKLCNENNFFDK